MSNAKILHAVQQPIFLLARTAPPSSELHAVIAANGMHLVHCATVQTVAEPMSKALSELLDAARAADWHVFVSPQAARAAHSLSPEIWSGSGRLAAVGATTAAALNRANVLVPTRGEGAQALLEMADLQHLAGKNVAIYAAPDGLALLANTLARRGARVLIIPVYRRVPSELTQQQAAQCSAAEYAYVGSVAFLEALLAARAGKLLPVLTPSERVAAAARALGCVAWVCDSTSDQAIAAQINRAMQSLRSSA